MAGENTVNSARQQAWQQHVRDVMALAVQLCHYNAPGCPLNSCCQHEPRCLRDAWVRINDPANDHPEHADSAQKEIDYKTKLLAVMEQTAP